MVKRYRWDKDGFLWENGNFPFPQIPNESFLVPAADYDEACAAEHAARCDLIDALFYVGMVWGQFGFPPTEAEREIAKSFWDRIQDKYPQKKGKRP